MKTMCSSTTTTLRAPLRYLVSGSVWECVNPDWVRVGHGERTHCGPFYSKMTPGEREVEDKRRTDQDLRLNGAVM
jgi:hypothetical protein